MRDSLYTFRPGACVCLVAYTPFDFRTKLPLSFNFRLKRKAKIVIYSDASIDPEWNG